VLVAVRVSVSSASASLSQSAFLPELQTIQAAITPTTSRIRNVQPRAPRPPDWADAGALEVDGVGVDVGVAAPADVAGAVFGGRADVGGAVLGGRADVGVSTDVGVRVVGVAALVRGGRVAGVAVVRGDPVTLVAERVPEGSVEERAVGAVPLPAPQPASPRSRPIVSTARRHAPPVILDVRIVVAPLDRRGRP
jgi:hypothetical protein